MQGGFCNMQRYASTAPWHRSRAEASAGAWSPARYRAFVCAAIAFFLAVAVLLNLGSLDSSGKAQRNAVPRSPRVKAVALVAVMTGFDLKYQQRREHARQTWFPASAEAMDRLHKETGLLLRFAIGEVPPKYEQQILEEERAYGPFLRIPVKDTYKRLTFKTAIFWGVVSRQFVAEYVIKVDDDSFVRLDRLAVAVSQWRGMGAEYVGCFKTRDDSDNRLRLRTHRWYDPHYQLFTGDGSRYAEGPFYVVPGRVLDGVVRSGLALRMDMMIGWVMKAFNITHFDDRRLCYKRACDAALVAFQWDHAVRDWLDPEYKTTTICCEEEGRCEDIARRDADGLACMHKLASDPRCASPTLDEDAALPLSGAARQELESDYAWIAAPL